MAENTTILENKTNPPQKGYCYLPHSKFPVPVTILSSSPSFEDLEGTTSTIAIKLENIFDTVNFLSWLKETNIDIIDKITSTDVIIIPSNWIIQSLNNVLVLGHPVNSINSQNVSPKVGDYVIWTKGFTLVQIDSIVTENSEVDLTVSRCAEGELTNSKFEERKLISLKVDPIQLLPLSELTKLQTITEENRISGEVTLKHVEREADKIVMLGFQSQSDSSTSIMTSKTTNYVPNQTLRKKNKKPKSAATPTSSGVVNETSTKANPKDDLKNTINPEKIQVYGNCYMLKFRNQISDVLGPDVVKINDVVTAKAGGCETRGRVRRICKIISQPELANDVMVGIQFEDSLTSISNFVEITHNLPDSAPNCCVNNKWVFIQLHLLLNKENGVFLLQREALIKSPSEECNKIDSAFKGPALSFVTEDNYNTPGVAGCQPRQLFANRKLAIRIRTLDGKTFPIEAMTYWRVRKLKEEIKKLTENETEDCLLLYKAKKLADNDRLSSYDILPESIIMANFSK